ncbi:MAG: S24/S26 family peptidase [Paramuribaculum sp.]|nr:S24/S26 family peptidase [Paramuribaculum sp.]
MTRTRIVSVVKAAVVNLAFAASCLFLLWLFCLLFVYASFTIPSDSMQPVIKPGDTVVVDKLSTGARLFDIARAARGDSVEIWRMPRWRRFRPLHWAALVYVIAAVAIMPVLMGRTGVSARTPPVTPCCYRRPTTRRRSTLTSMT